MAQFTAEALAGARFPNLIAIVADDKGGCGKSTLAGVTGATFDEAGGRVRMIDADATNSTTASTYAAKFVDLRATDARGGLATTISEIGSKYDQVVIDMGARDEDFVRKHQLWLQKLAERVKASLVVLRPITTDVNTQVKAAEFAALARSMGIAVVFVMNLGQGRREEDFRSWLKSDTLKRALESGVVQTTMADANSVLIDGARSFQLSLSDVAHGRFERAGDDIERAKELFSKDTQAWMSIWLSEQTEAIGPAILEALSK